MLVHDRRGEGPPLVLIHGIGARRGAWDPVVQRLTDRETIAVDTPGFGDAPPLPAGAPVTMEAYIDAFEAFFAELGLDRPHVAGNSMGGGIALELARRGSVASATALSPIGFWNGPESTYSRASLKLTRFLSLHAAGLLKRGVSSAVRPPAAARPDVRPPGEARRGGRAPRRRQARRARPASRRRCRRSAPTSSRAGRSWTACRSRSAGGRATGCCSTARSPRARRRRCRTRGICRSTGCGHLPMWDDPDAVAALLRAATATSPVPVG